MDRLLGSGKDASTTHPLPLPTMKTTSPTRSINPAAEKPATPVTDSAPTTPSLDNPSRDAFIVTSGSVSPSAKGTVTLALENQKRQENRRKELEIRREIQRELDAEREGKLDALRVEIERAREERLKEEKAADKLTREVRRRDMEAHAARHREELKRQMMEESRAQDEAALEALRLELESHRVATEAAKARFAEAAAVLEEAAARTRPAETSAVQDRIAAP